MLCTDISAPRFLILSDHVPQLLYYSHFPAAIIALLLGVYVFVNNKKLVSAQILFVISLLFSLWSFFDLILWTNVNSEMIMFFWSIINFVEILVSLFTLYFAYVYLEKKDIHFFYKIIFFFLLLPFALLVPTIFNVPDFNLALCEATQGPLIKYYYFLEGLLFVSLIVYLSIKTIKSKKDEMRKETAFFSVGVVLFLLSFSGANIIGSITENWKILQYGLFGMPIFMGFLAYLIVRYKAFNIKLIAAQALVVGIIILIASQFAFIQNNINRILTGITLAIVSVFGWWLVKSVKKVDEQREQLELANEQLERLDKAKNEFINIASHQLRTPITVIKGVISMLQDGTMDKFDAPTKAKFIEGASAKCKKLEDIINGILNATSLTNKKLNVMDKESEKINVKEFLSGIVDGFKTEVVNRKIDLILAELDSSVPEIYGQKQYLEEAFSNLISNAIKYTPSPSQTDDVRNSRNSEAKIVISNKREGDFVTFSVKDNGIGIPPEAIPELFKKFSRAKNAMDMYIDGTGLGLFIIKEIAEGHGGTAWVESELGKGSEFFIKLPIRPGQKVNVKEYIQERAETKM